MLAGQCEGTVFRLVEGIIFGVVVAAAILVVLPQGVAVKLRRYFVVLFIGFFGKNGHGGGIRFLAMYFSASSALASQSSAWHCCNRFLQRFRMPARIMKSGTSPRSARSIKKLVRLIFLILIFREYREKGIGLLDVSFVFLSACFQLSCLHEGNPGNFREENI